MSIFETDKSFGLKCYSQVALNILRVALSYVHNSFQSSISAEASVTVYSHIANMIGSVFQNDEYAPDGEILVNNRQFVNDRFWTEERAQNALADVLDKYLKYGKMYERAEDKYNPIIYNFKEIKDQSFRLKKNLDKTVYGTVIEARPGDARKLVLYQEQKVEFVEINLRNIRILKDFLHHKKIQKIIREFGQEDVKKVIGEPRNPLWIEQIKTKNEEINRLKDQLAAESIRLSSDKDKKIKLIEAEFLAKHKVIEDEYNEKIYEINRKYEEISRKWEEMS